MTATSPHPLEAAKCLGPLALPLLSERPLVSVLVSNYNYAAYLPETITSVLEQTYTSWELIICDDGSTDASVEIISRFMERDSRIRLIQKENGGHASGVNAAFEACSGTIICLLDSDDIFSANKLDRVVDYCIQNPDRGLIVHRMMRVAHDRQKQGVWPLVESLPDGWYAPRLLTDGGMVPYMPPTSGLSMRREVAEYLFPLTIKAPLRICPDQVLMRLSPLVTPIGGIQENLAEQRLHYKNTYGTARITADSLAREMSLNRALWEEQKALLRSIDEDLAHAFQPIEGSEHMLFLDFLRAKLSRDPEAGAYHHRYFEALKTTASRKTIGLWHVLRYVPMPLFDRLLNLMYGQNKFKQAVARLRGVA